MNTSKLFTDKDLCVVLSDIFVDNWANYEYIASVAKNFSIGYVEYIFIFSRLNNLFERVYSTHNLSHEINEGI